MGRASDSFSVKVSTSRLDEVNREEWNAFVSKTGEGTFFHGYEWLKLNEVGLGVPLFTLQARRGGRLIGGFPYCLHKPRDFPASCIDSLPMGFGGPILRGGGDRRRTLDLLFEELETLASTRGVYLTRIRTTGNGHLAYSCYFESRGFFPVVRNCSFRIDLQRPMDEVLDDFTPPSRRNLRKAERSGLSVRNCTFSATHMNEFYTLYRKTMRRRGGAVHHKRLFEGIPEYLGDKVLLISALHPELHAPIAMMVHLVCANSRTIYYYWGGSDPQYQSSRPNELLHVWTMRWGMDRNFNTYDLGGTNADFELGLYRFKRNLGGIPYPNILWIRSRSPWAWRLHRWGRHLYRMVRSPR
jgi:hypothetical protein